MNSDIKIGVIGGDERQLITAHALADVGFEVAAFGFGSIAFDRRGMTRCSDLRGAVEGSAAIILPLPYSRDGEHLFCPLGSAEEKNIRVSYLFEIANSSQIVIGGNFGEQTTDLAKRLDIKLHDYYRRDEVGILNAVPSAEGALAIAMSELPVTIYGSAVHILGFGKIGKVLAKSAYALGAAVTVHSRAAADMAWSRVYGYKSADITKLEDEEHPFKGAAVVFNTVPKQIITEPVLEKTEKDTLIIDLASDPGGVDPETAKKLGIRTIRALSLPGKTAPVSAGKIISDSIFGILQAEGITP